MPTFNLKRFSRPAALKAIRPDHLLELLAPHGTFFDGRGVPLPKDGSAIDYDGLARVFMMPEADTPQALANALYLIHEMATAERMDELVAALEGRGHHLNGDQSLSPADVAVRAWLHDPALLEQKHAERHLTRPRSFEYFQTNRDPAPAFQAPTPETIAALEGDLDSWFAKNRRGRGSRVKTFHRDDCIMFLVQHGEPLERKGVMKDGEPDSLVFRAEAHDVVAYDAARGELKIHAATKGEKDLYRKMFGRHLFGDDNFFPGTAKYTLEPLRTHGAKSLACTDVEGIESVKLKQVEFFWGGPEKEVEVRKANDVFAAFETRGRNFPERARITKASFAVKFKGSKTPRTVIVKPSNVTQYARDGDSTVAEEWLRKREFMLNGR